MTFDTKSPRGVALSPDGKTLYVAETDNTPGGVRELRAYPILEDGTLDAYVVLHTFGSDRRGVHRGIEGMCVDSEGNIVACAGWRRSGPGPLVYVFAPSGAILETHEIPGDVPLNCAFGDADFRFALRQHGRRRSVPREVGRAQRAPPLAVATVRPEEVRQGRRLEGLNQFSAMSLA